MTLYITLPHFIIITNESPNTIQPQWNFYQSIPLFFLKILFWSDLHTQRGAWTYNPEIKGRILYHMQAYQVPLSSFKIIWANICGALTVCQAVGQSMEEKKWWL